MPRHRFAAETRGKSGEHRFGERDFGEQHERLLARIDCRRDRLHIDFGLARSGDAVEQQRCRIWRRRPRRGAAAAAACSSGQVGRREGGVGCGVWLVGRHSPLRARRSGRGRGLPPRSPRPARQVRAPSLPLADRFERHRPLRRHARRQLARRAIFDDRALGVGKGDAGQHHAQHRPRRREIIVARPFDQAAERRGHRRNGYDFVKIAQPVVADRPGAPKLSSSHTTPPIRRGPAATTTTLPSGASPALRHAIVERAEGGSEEEDAGAGHGCGRI